MSPIVPGFPEPHPCATMNTYWDRAQCQSAGISQNWNSPPRTPDRLIPDRNDHRRTRHTLRTSTREREMQQQEWNRQTLTTEDQCCTPTGWDMDRDENGRDRTDRFGKQVENGAERNLRGSPTFGDGDPFPVRAGRENPGKPALDCVEWFPGVFSAVTTFSLDL